MFKSKYIIIDTGIVVGPIVFSEVLGHDEIASAIVQGGNFEEVKQAVLGAGFCYIQNNRYVCYGESRSLRVKSRGEEDAAFLNRYLGVDQA